MITDTNITKKKIQLCFNKAASTYDSNNTVQQIIGKNLITQLCSHQIQPKHIIDLGCGSGVITEKLACALPCIQFHAIDISNSLLALAQKRLVAYPIKIYEHDFEQFDIHNTLFDLAFSNMALHWSINFEVTLQKIHHLLASGGIIAFSIPLAGTFAEINHNSRNAFYPLSTIVKNVTKAGFDIIEQSTEIIVINFDSVLSALKSIKSVGANYLFKQPYCTLRGKAFLKKIAPFKNTAEEPFSLTYNIGYVIARKR